jgi:hypothetical protein
VVIQHISDKPPLISKQAVIEMNQGLVEGCKIIFGWGSILADVRGEPLLRLCKLLFKKLDFLSVIINLLPQLISYLGI